MPPSAIGDLTFHGEVCEERYNRRFAQVARVSPVVPDLVEADELFDPTQLRFLHFEDVVEESQLVANPSEEFPGGPSEAEN